jgi:release factor glutamine methyltransferase
MDKQELFGKFVSELENKLHLLNDKPEESVRSTLCALWLKAAGIPASAEKALTLPLPTLKEDQIAYLTKLIQMRVENTPLAYITGRQNFMGVELLTDKRALIPRKETEILGRKALQLSRELSGPENTIQIMDVCCGSGNLGITVAYSNPNCKVYASDISQEAVELTQENINLLNLNQRVSAKQGDMMSAFEKDEYYGKFDLILCNPPYISSSKVLKMDHEISMNEPSVAFDGGMLGIKIIQKLIHDAPGFLKKGGWLTFEVGLGQGPMISQVCERTQQFGKIETGSDNSDHIRVISVQKLN